MCYFRVQELMGGEQRETGRIPRTMECHLTSDLCDSCVPGDTVTVTAIVRVANEGTDTAKHSHCNLVRWFVVGSHFYFWTQISSGEIRISVCSSSILKLFQSATIKVLSLIMCVFFHSSVTWMTWGRYSLYFSYHQATRCYLIFRSAVQVRSRVKWVSYRWWRVQSEGAVCHPGDPVTAQPAQAYSTVRYFKSSNKDYCYENCLSGLIMLYTRHYLIAVTVCGDL